MINVIDQSTLTFAPEPRACWAVVEPPAMLGVATLFSLGFKRKTSATSGTEVEEAQAARARQDQAAAQQLKEAEALPR